MNLKNKSLYAILDWFKEEKISKLDTGAEIERRIMVYAVQELAKYIKAQKKEKKQ
jgi:hypothetical protein